MCMGNGPAAPSRTATPCAPASFTSTEAPASLSQMAKLLVIDDDAKMRRSLVALLLSDGHYVLEAGDGREGVEAARREHPELILCDITMPRMNGHRVLQTLREDPLLASTPFIFLTGWDDREDVRTGMNLGADDYLVKPVVPADLLAAVQARLKRRDLQIPSPAAAQLPAPAELATKLSLSPREAEILSWVMQGKTNPEIGIITGIKLTTVKKHLESIYAKLGVDNRTAAVMLAMERPRPTTGGTN